MGGPLEEVLVNDSNDMDSPDYLKALELLDTGMRDEIEELLKLALTERQAEIIRMRYGLDDGIPKTLDEIGEKFQVTRERVRQIETKVARKLKLNKEDDLIHKELYVLLEYKTELMGRTKFT